MHLNTSFVDGIFSTISGFLDTVLFYDLSPFPGIRVPFLIFWLLFTSCYFLFRTKMYDFKFIPIAVKYFMSSKIEEYQKKKSQSDKKYGQTSKSIILFSIGSNVDLGTVFGTAVAVHIAGRGVLLWMIVITFLSTAFKMIEVFIAHSNRSIGSDFTSGGPQAYIDLAFRNVKLPNIGKFVKYIFCFSIIISTFFSPQINQTVAIINHFSSVPQHYNWAISLVISVFVISLLYSGFDSLTKFLRRIAPLVGYLYFIGSLVVIAFNADNLLPTLKGIVLDGLSLKNGIGGLVATIVLATQRTFFCTEIGMGSAGISHSNSVNEDSFSEAILSTVAPLISICLVALCSGLVVATTNAHVDNSNGISMLVAAFQTVHKNFPLLLILVVPLFGFSTAVAWAYYGQKLWMDIFGKKSAWVYISLLFCAYWGCGYTTNFKSILDAADMLNLAITIPNVIAIYILGNKSINAMISRTKGKSFKQFDTYINNKLMDI